MQATAAAAAAVAAVTRAVKDKDKQLSGRAVIYSHLHLVRRPPFYAAEWLVDFLFFFFFFSSSGVILMHEKAAARPTEL